MNIGAAVFGAFCLILIIGGVVYIGAVNAQQTPLTDTYGNTLSPVANGSQQLVTTTTTTGESTGIWLILIAAVILVCLVIVGIYVAAKTLNL